MTRGFCVAENTDVEIGPDRKCLNDGTYALAPSTGCAHQRWLTGGGWSVCVGEAERGQRKPCALVAADTWRTVLEQQERAVAKQNRDQAARRFSARAETAPRLRTSHKPRLGGKTKLVICADCAEEKIHSGMGRCDRCYRRHKRGLLPGETRVAPPMDTVPCPVCETPVKPYLMKKGKRRRFCSTACFRKQAEGAAA